jgi:selenocysteine lyase/cysteine desulfurase
MLKYPFLDYRLLRSREFPITKDKVFLAHAAVSPLPRRIVTVIEEYIKLASEKGQWNFIHGDTESQTRSYAAQILKACEDEITFVSSTSMGLSMVAEGLPWDRGDNVVVYGGGFSLEYIPLDETA